MQFVPHQARRLSRCLSALHGRTGADEMMLVVGGHSSAIDECGIALIADHYNMPHA